MTTITRFRSLPVRMRGDVDREKKIIYGVSLAQAGEALGHGMDLDAITLENIVELGNQRPKGVKSRYTHPGLSADGLGKFLGRVKDLRVVGDKAIGDLHLSPLAFKSPEGNLGEYIMDFAEEDPEAFGMSVVIGGELFWRTAAGEEVPVEDGRPDDVRGERPVVRVSGLYAVDAVDEPAANRDGMFSAHLWGTNRDAEEAFAYIDELLERYAVSPEKAREFAQKYFYARGYEMAENILNYRYSETPEVEPDYEPDLEVVALRGEVEDMREALNQAAIEAGISKSGLSDEGQALLRVAMRDRHVDELQALIDAQRTVEAKLSERAVVEGVNPAPGARITGMRNSLDKLQVAVDALVAGSRAPDGVHRLQGLRDLYMLTSGDYDMTGHFRPENISLAAVTSATMPALVANAMNKVLIQAYTEIPRFWGPIVRELDSTNLQQLRWLQLGGVTDIPEVAEGAAYQEIGWTDATETGDWKKKGYYMGLTMEAIDKDDTSRLKQAPRVMAIAANRTLGKDISYLYTQESGTGPLLASDSTRWFTSGHGNLGSTAFTRASVKATILAMQKQTELGSGERLGDLVRPRYYMLPIDLEFTALEVLGSMFDGTEGTTTARLVDNVFTDADAHSARMREARSQIILNPFMTDTNDWVAIADPMKWPTVAVAYRFGRAPELFSQQDPNSGLMFTNDTLPIKVRFIYNVSVLNYRGVYKHNVT